MPTPKEIIGHISSGRVPDVVTGSGGFIHFLLEGLKDYIEIISVNDNEEWLCMDVLKKVPRPKGIPVFLNDRYRFTSPFPTASSTLRFLKQNIV